MKKLLGLLTLSLLAGIGLTYFLGLDFLTNKKQFVIVLFYVAAILYFASLYSLNYLLDHFKILTKQGLYICIAVGTVLYIIAVLLLPIQRWGPESSNSLQVIASGEKSASALNSEVWLNKATIDNVPLDLKTLDYDKSKWELRPDALVSYPSFSAQPASLNINYRGTSIKLVFTSHPYSGKVNIIQGSNKESIDLFNADSTQFKEFAFKSGESVTVIPFMLFGFFFIISLLVVVSLVLRMLNYHANEHAPFSFLKVFLLIVFINMFYFFLLYPGNMTPDSIDQWSQREKFEFTNHHPVFSTLYVWLLSTVWHSPAAVSLFQVFLVAFVHACILRNISRYKRTSPKMLKAVTIFIAVFPLHGFMTVTLWKDVPYAIFFLVMTVSLILMVLSRGEWISRNSNKAILCLSLVGISLVKHDGLYVAAITLLMLMIYFFHKIKSFLKMAAIFIIIIVVAKGMIVSGLSKQDAPSWMAYTLPIHQVKLILGSPDAVVSSEDDAFFKKVFTAGPGGNSYVQVSPYNPYTGVQSAFNADEFIQNKSEFLKRWATLLYNNKKLAFSIWKKQTSLIWSIKRPLEGYQYVVNTGIVVENHYGLVAASKLPQLKPFIAEKWEYILGADSLSWFFGRPAIFIYFTLFCALVFALRNGWQATIVIIPFLASIGGLALTIQAQDTRYLYSAFLIAPYMFLYSFIPKQS